MPLKPTELRIDNLVRFFMSGVDHGIVPVTADLLRVISRNNGAYCEGVELTEEILIECGFWGDRHNLPHWPLFVIKENGLTLCQSVENEDAELTSVKYVHELQNCIYCLTKEELPITLPAQNEEDD